MLLQLLCRLSFPVIRGLTATCTFIRESYRVDMIRQMPWIPFTFLITVLALFSTPVASQDPSGYILPSSGTASTTQFQLGPELQSGTSCGMSAWPHGINAGNPPDGGGPGFLYAAINQLGFGANPSGIISRMHYCIYP